jgi:hypothetical protein
MRLCGTRLQEPATKNGVRECMKTNNVIFLGLTLGFSVLACFATSCSDVSDSSNIRQSIPVKLQKAVIFEVYSLRRQEYPVGICCPPEVWQRLTNSPNSIHASLASADSPETRIWGVGGTQADGNDIADFHYLFMIGGSGNAVVRIVFPGEPPAAEHANIVIKRSPTQSL